MRHHAVCKLQCVGKATCALEFISMVMLCMVARVCLQIVRYYVLSGNCMYYYGKKDDLTPKVWMRSCIGVGAIKKQCAWVTRH